MQISFFEDEVSSHFKPLTLTRPVWDLRIGILTIYDKWKKNLDPEHITWESAPHLNNVFASPDLNESKPCLYINSRFLPSDTLVKCLENLNTGEAIYFDDVLIALNSTSPIEPQKFSELDEFKKIHIDFKPRFIEYLWDLLNFNGSEIISDIKLLKLSSKFESEKESYTVTNKENIYIADSAVIEPGVILMADKGPIFIGENCTIEAGSILKGPVAVCDNATIKMRARIYDGSTIGPHCKVGGEVASTIFHSYSNKAHDGYAGNSIFGQWCNLGADSNTSNLKNNYDFVRIQDWETKQPYKVGFQFFGTVMGDHSKTSINAMLSTGTTCGVSSNIFPSGFPPKYISSFTWVDGENNPEFRFEKALEVMKAMMARRKVELTPEYQQMMEYIFSKR